MTVVREVLTLSILLLVGPGDGERGGELGDVEQMGGERSKRPRTAARSAVVDRGRGRS